jgi:hypothetical protein
MPLTSEQNQRLAELARGLITGLGAVEAAAGWALREQGGRTPGTGALALPANTMVGPIRAVGFLEGIREQKIQDLARLCQEPFVTRVIVERASGT